MAAGAARQRVASPGARQPWRGGPTWGLAPARRAYSSRAARASARTSGSQPRGAASCSRVRAWPMMLRSSASTTFAGVSVVVSSPAGGACASAQRLRRQRLVAATQHRHASRCAAAAAGVRAPARETALQPPRKAASLRRRARYASRLHAPRAWPAAQAAGRRQPRAAGARRRPPAEHGKGRWVRQSAGDDRGTQICAQARA